MGERAVEVGEDALLGRRVRLRQPRHGYRAAIDPVLLAAAVPARTGDRVLDLGAGVGAAALCLAARVAGCRITGLEMDPDLAALGNQNATLNGVADRVHFVIGDVAAPPAALTPGGFDQVMINPPYLTATVATPSPRPGKAAAHVEGDGAGLSVWLDRALELAGRHAGITVIHRAERLDQILTGLGRRAGALVVFPLWPKAGRPAKRVIVHAIKGRDTLLRLSPGLVLHQPDGGYTAAAEAALRDAEPLAI